MLFTPLTIGNLKLANRIVVSPMCQYSALNGVMNEWHLQHITQLALSGAGLVMIESTAIEKVGRITHYCTGLYDTKCEFSIKSVMKNVKKIALPTTKFGIQLGHAGRKASTQRPWEGRKFLNDKEYPWQTYAPSPIPFDNNWHVPKEIKSKDFSRIKKAYVKAAIRAVDVGFDLIEIHAAHGYLLHQFLSPISNKRTDNYGGNLENRMRFPLEVFDAIKTVIKNVPIGMRITGTEWEEGGFNIQESIIFANELRELGCNYVCVSSAGNTPNPKIPLKPHYQVHLAEDIKKNVKILTRTVGMITIPKMANDILLNGQADMVALGRAFLTNPRWVWDAANLLGEEIEIPNQYKRRFKKL